MQKYTFFLLFMIANLLVITGCQLPDPIEFPEACKPKADFIIVNNNSLVDTPIQFTNLSENATSYQWDFGDGQTSKEAVPVHIFGAAGEYTVTLTAICGQEEQKFAGVVTVIPNDPVKPISCFTFSCLTEPCVAPAVISFNGGCSTNAESYLWDFDHLGHTSNTVNTQYIFETPGAYQVKLTVSRTEAGVTFEDDMTLSIQVKAWECGDPLVDIRDEKAYQTVKIGNQCWMKENLDFEVEGSACYDNDPDNCETFGRLYTWTAAMAGSTSSDNIPSGVRGICPQGWHLPSNKEWDKLIDFVGGGENAANALRAKDHWDPPFTATDLFGFSALPAGLSYDLITYESKGNYVQFLTSVDYPNRDGFTWVNRVISIRNNAYDYIPGHWERERSGTNIRATSCRCLKD